jgi:hypothetical protein
VHVVGFNLGVFVVKKSVTQRKDYHNSSNQHQIFKRRIKALSLPLENSANCFAWFFRETQNGIWQALLLKVEGGKKQIFNKSFDRVSQVLGFLAAFMAEVPDSFR